MTGEQGAESIHSRFNTLARTYSSMQNNVEQNISGDQLRKPVEEVAETLSHLGFVIQ